MTNTLRSSLGMRYTASMNSARRGVTPQNRDVIGISCRAHQAIDDAVQDSV